MDNASRALHIQSGTEDSATATATHQAGASVGHSVCSIGKIAAAAANLGTCWPMESALLPIDFDFDELFYIHSSYSSQTKNKPPITSHIFNQKTKGEYFTARKHPNLLTTVSNLMVIVMNKGVFIFA